VASNRQAAPESEDGGGGGDPQLSHAERLDECEDMTAKAGLVVEDALPDEEALGGAPPRFGRTGSGRAAACCTRKRPSAAGSPTQTKRFEPWPEPKGSEVRG
jgi:hypothetical protein